MAASTIFMISLMHLFAPDQEELWRMRSKRNFFEAQFML
jgi:hypothetical protein